MSIDPFPSSRALSVQSSAISKGTGEPALVPLEPGQGQLDLFHQYANKAGVQQGKFRVIDSRGKTVSGALMARGSPASLGWLQDRSR